MHITIYIHSKEQPIAKYICCVMQCTVHHIPSANSHTYRILCGVFDVYFDYVNNVYFLWRICNAPSDIVYMVNCNVSVVFSLTVYIFIMTYILYNASSDSVLIVYCEVYAELPLTVYCKWQCMYCKCGIRSGVYNAPSDNVLYTNSKCGNIG